MAADHGARRNPDHKKLWETKIDSCSRRPASDVDGEVVEPFGEYIVSLGIISEY